MKTKIKANKRADYAKKIIESMGLSKAKKTQHYLNKKQLRELSEKIDKLNERS